jgi:hypothetical protein
MPCAIVYRNVPVTFQRSIPSRFPFCRASGHRAGCRGRHTVRRRRRLTMRLARPRPQSQETCRVSLTPSLFTNTRSAVAWASNSRWNSAQADTCVFYRKGHYGRALEEAIQTQKSQWPTKWTGNPLSGGRNFNTMTAVERVSSHLS